jgi:hypothetical protein
MVLFIIQNHDLDFEGTRIFLVCRGTAVGMYVQSAGGVIVRGCAPFLQDKVFVRIEFVKSNFVGKIRLLFGYSGPPLIFSLSTRFEKDKGQKLTIV